MLLKLRAKLVKLRRVGLKEESRTQDFIITGNYKIRQADNYKNSRVIQQARYLSQDPDTTNTSISIFRDTGISGPTRNAIYILSIRNDNGYQYIMNYI